MAVYFNNKKVLYTTLPQNVLISLKIKPFENI